MAHVTLRDHMGREHIIQTPEDVNRLVGELERHRDRLADLMLGSDRPAALAAERESDTLEDVYLPRFQQELTKLRALFEVEAADEHRRAKARSIKNRGGAND